jgi:asparagine synthase (glutamine-hydrolysing)
MAMAHAVEVRVPFLDRDLLDFALSVDESFKLRDGVAKEPVKRLAARYVGREAVYRPKTGFGVPIQHWFRTGLGAHMATLIEEDRAEVERYFDIGELRRRLIRPPGTVNEAFQLWIIYNLLNWRRAILSQPRCAVA